MDNVDKMAQNMAMQSCVLELQQLRAYRLSTESVLDKAGEQLLRAKTSVEDSEARVRALEAKVEKYENAIRHVIECPMSCICSRIMRGLVAGG